MQREILQFNVTRTTRDIGAYEFRGYKILLLLLLHFVDFLKLWFWSLVLWIGGVFGLVEVVVEEDFFCFGVLFVLLI